ncbi:MAG: tetratricopeptide repeat protein [Thermoguttaceae bacterium]|jgi:tetratricopeptide (TPR) repeat protein
MSKRKKTADNNALQIGSKTFVPSGLPLGVLVGAAIIIVAAFFAYSPSLNGDFIWDDKDLYLTENPIIKSADGLFRFWCTTEPWDFYPLSNTTLWIEWRLWEMNSTGYHLTNLILHIAEALLIWIILRKLSIPGGFLAAVVFALHPVNVESVAWISQRKDMLAVLFFLLSILWYLRFVKPAPRPTFGWCPVAAKQSTAHCPPSTANRFSWYCLSLSAFVLAMLSKGSVTILPVFLLGIACWLRPLTRRDLLRIAPFFAVAAALTVVNVWFQRHGSGEIIRSADFTQRLLGAGGVVWFYLYKALLPLNLLFIYPQWHIDPGNPLWWLPLSAALVLTAILWRYRKTWSRPFLFAWVFFCAALAPVMGFTDVFFMRYSLVADHYQHIALIPVIALLAAGFSLWRRSSQGTAHRLATEAAVLVLGILAFLTCLQSAEYSDEITLYTATVEKDPNSWMAHNNLGSALWQKGFQQEAIDHFDQSLKLNPNYPQVHVNFGAALLHTDRRQEALDHLHEALKLKPNDSKTLYILGNAAREDGRLQDAIDYFRQALSAKPDYLDVLNNLGLALVRAGRPREAIESYQAALKIDPDLYGTEYNLGNAYKQMGQSLPAIEHFEKALKLARSQGQTDLAVKIEKSLNSYRADLPSAPSSPPTSQSPSAPP